MRVSSFKFQVSSIVLASCILQLATNTVFSASPIEEGIAKAAVAKTGQEKDRGKEESLVELLENRNKELDKREIELNEREARLKQVSQEIEAKIARLGKLREESEGYFKKIDAVEAEKIAHLVKIYESMPPKDAAARMEQLDEDTAILVLSKMKQRAAAKVLALIEPGLAAGLSRGVIKPFNLNPAVSRK